MSTSTAVSRGALAPQLHGQTVLCIGGSSGIGLQTARHARAAGADVMVTGRSPERLRAAADELEPVATATFDATDPDALRAFFDQLASPIDHVMVTAGGPYYAPLAEMDVAKARRAVDEHLWLMIELARLAVGRVRGGGTLVFMGGIAGRSIGVGRTVGSAMAAALPAVTANLALEVAPIRVNLIAAGFVDTPLSASLLGDRLERRRRELSEALPIGRVVEPGDIAALAVHLMTNTAVTGATLEVDGGEQLLPG